MAPKPRSKGPASPIRASSAASPLNTTTAIPRKTTKVVKKKAAATPKRKQRKLGRSDSANARANVATTTVLDENEDGDLIFPLPRRKIRMTLLRDDTSSEGSLDVRYPLEVKSPRTLVSTDNTTARILSSLQSRFPRLEADLADPAVDWESEIDYLRSYYFPYAAMLKGDKATSDAIQDMLLFVRQLAAAGNQEEAKRVFENAVAHMDSIYRAQQEIEAVFTLADDEDSDHVDTLESTSSGSILAQPRQAAEYVSMREFKALEESVDALWDIVMQDGHKLKMARMAAIEEIERLDGMDESDEI